MNIKSIRCIKKNCKVYDIEVETDHSFIVNECVLHNCITCGSMHGLRYKSITEAPSIPQHCACRCVYIAADGSKEEMPTYEEFLNSLSEEEQKEILGKSRYEMWKNDGIKLERFVNNGRKLRLDEIDKE